jgi:hypothetical protein
MYSRLEIDENGARNVVRVVCLIEEDVLAVVAGDGEIFQNTLTET